MSTEQQDKHYTILLCVFIGSLTIASVLANKIISVFGLFVPAGILAYSVTFICSDVISEIWGKERAKHAVTGGFFALITTFLVVQISLAWPGAPFWEGEESFKIILGSTSRIIIASFVAYLISQFHDVWAFHMWKRLTNGKHLWLRNNLSTGVSQFLDSFVFVTIAFYGVMPVWPLIIGQWCVKMLIALLDTPVIYGVIWYIRKDSKVQQTQDFVEAN
jgi:hypothetical protein